jgi:excisionase family DNA binding protein
MPPRTASHRSTPVSDKPGKPPGPRLALSRQEAAQALSLSDELLDGLIRRGELRTVRVGRRILVSVQELNRWLDSREARRTDL